MGLCPFYFVLGQAEGVRVWVSTPASVLRGRRCQHVPRGQTSQTYWDRRLGARATRRGADSAGWETSVIVFHHWQARGWRYSSSPPRNHRVGTATKRFLTSINTPWIDPVSKLHTISHNPLEPLCHFGNGVNIYIIELPQMIEILNIHGHIHVSWSCSR